MTQTEADRGKTGVNMRARVIWMTRTAVFIALLVVLQAVSSLAGNQLVTGTIVNAVLVVCVMTCGLASGLTLAAVSPILAAYFGIGPHWALAPFIALGNLVLILLWDIIGNRLGKRRLFKHQDPAARDTAAAGDRSSKRRLISLISALIIAAAAKCAVLYLGVVKIAVPMVLQLEASRAAMISAMFSVPQLITALSGGTLALVIITTYGKIIERIKHS